MVNAVAVEPAAFHDHRHNDRERKMSDTTGGGTTTPTDPNDPGVHRGADVKPKTGPVQADDDTPPDPGVHRG
jgi:hypothetical protein